MRKSLPNDGRIVRMMSALNADRFRTLGGVLSVWCLIDEQTEDGILDGYTAQSLDEIIGFPGIAEAMEKVGWLQIYKDYILAPDFDKHNGATAKRRAQESVRKMSARNADKMRPREEKRREEKIKTNTSASAEVSAEASETPALPRPPGEPTEFTFECVGKGEKTWTLPKSKLDEYLEAYPDLDVRAEIRKSRQWIRDNPTNRKTAAGMASFLTRWLNRVQNNPRRTSDGTQPSKQQRQVDALERAIAKAEQQERDAQGSDAAREGLRGLPGG
jgi:hypothetical protein